MTQIFFSEYACRDSENAPHLESANPGGLMQTFGNKTDLLGPGHKSIFLPKDAVKRAPWLNSAFFEKICYSIVPSTTFFDGKEPIQEKMMGRTRVYIPWVSTAPKTFFSRQGTCMPLETSATHVTLLGSRNWIGIPEARWEPYMGVYWIMEPLKSSIQTTYPHTSKLKQHLSVQHEIW